VKSQIESGKGLNLANHPADISYSPERLNDQKSKKLNKSYKFGGWKLSYLTVSLKLPGQSRWAFKPVDLIKVYTSL